MTAGAQPHTPPRDDEPRFASLGVPAGVISRVGVLTQLVEAASAATGRRVLLSPALLGARAAALGLSRGGRTSAGGACRLIRCLDGWLAVNLARPEDEVCVAAWLAVAPVVPDVPDVPGEAAGLLREQLWPVIERVCVDTPTSLLLEQAQLLGLPVAKVPADLPTSHGSRWLRFLRPPSARLLRRQSFRVVDLSSLWAGPLCAWILGQAGATVTKVESEERPDGARQGPSAFYEELHAGKEELRFPFRTGEGRDRLRALLAEADVVIEASRPRALRQLDIEAEAIVADHPGLVWISLTAYGREGDDANRVGFGDDVAAGAGLVEWVGGEPRFVGDAIADPIAGITAALGGLSARLAGGGCIVDVSMHDAAAFVGRTGSVVDSRGR